MLTKPQNKHPVVLYRALDTSPAEQAALYRYFPRSTESRVDARAGDLVIGRYSVLPFYADLARDLRKLGASLINSPAEHNYVADLRNWTKDLGVLTPRMWERLEDIPEQGSFVVKGATNSRKDQWATHMYAPTKADAIQIALRLMDDSLIGQQPIYVREYVPLKRLATGLNGLPITEEYRFFVAYGRVLCGAFYWSSYVEDLPEVPNAANVPEAFLKDAISKVEDKIPFFALDVARTESGQWLVIELNDGQMSGLSENNPDNLYGNLEAWLWEVFCGPHNT